MTRVRLQLLDAAGTAAAEASEQEPLFEPAAPDALLVPACALVVIAGAHDARKDVAGARDARADVAAAFVLALSAHGLRVYALPPMRGAASRAELGAALESLGAVADVIVAEGNAPLALCRATLSVTVGAAPRPLRGRADVEVQDASRELVTALAALVARSVALGG